jgi:hypothetical protein
MLKTLSKRREHECKVGLICNPIAPFSYIFSAA